MNTENYNTLTKEELATRLALAQRKIDGLERSKRRVGLSFRRVPESGHQINRLYNGDFPYLQHIPSLSYSLADRHTEETFDGKPLSVPTDGNITLIEGDNLPVLTALQLTHHGRIDVIYIDPPYNTGNNDFIYNDARKSSISDIEGAAASDYEATLEGKARVIGRDDPERHSLWLSFMEKRLYLAKELMSETGVIFVSIDDHEQARLKLLMDEVFGEQNFIANVIRTTDGGTRQFKYFKSGKDYVLSYAKNIDISSNFIEPLSQEYIEKFSKSDSTGKYVEKGLYQASLSSTGRKMRFYIECPDGSLCIPPGKTFPEKVEGLAIASLSEQEKIWRWGPEKFKENKNNLIFKRVKNSPLLNEHGNQSDWNVYVKQYLDLSSTMNPSEILSGFSSSKGTSDLKGILGEGSFSYPKPISLIKFLCNLQVNSNAIILDFFAGSGTTGQAVAELNKEDGGSRQCILVTHGDENGKNIAEDVTTQRMKRVLSGKDWADGNVHEGLPGEFNYYKLAFAPKTQNIITAVETMQSKFVGFAALQQDVVLSEQTNSNYSILTNSSKIVAIVKNEEYLLDEIDEFYGVLEKLKTDVEDSGRYRELIVYVPSDSAEDSYDFGSLGWKNISFPLEYIEAHANLINRMKKNKTLLPPIEEENLEKDETMFKISDDLIEESK